MGASKTFDFNSTLPTTVFEFLLLMTFLDKTWFGPVGRVIDQRDAKIASSLRTGRDSLVELERMKLDTKNVLEEARINASAVINNANSEATRKADDDLNEAK